MILATLAIAAIAWGVIGTAVTGMLSAERNLIADPLVLLHVGITGAGVFGLAYLLT